MTKQSLLLTSAIYVATQIGAAQAETVDWSGAYAGLSFDYSAIDFGSESNEDGTYGGQLHPSVTGTLGYNFQRGGFVYGFEALITNGGQFDRQEYSQGDLPDTEGGEYDFNWSATLRAKAGIAQGNTLFYGALGATYADVDLTRCDDFFGVDCDTDVDSDNKIASGVWGANIALGAEFAINPRLSGFFEYNVTIFDEILSDTVALGGPDPDGDLHTFYLGRDQLRLGLNYAFSDRNTITSAQSTDAAWAGGYVGVLASAAKTSDSTGYYDSAFKGGQWDAAPTIVAGYNWQKGNVVYGIEGDITGPLASSKFYYDSDYVSDFNTDWTATLRGRIGITSGNALFFATAGVAASKGDIIGCEPASGFEYQSCDASRDNNVRTNTDTLTGFTAGFGLEYAVSSNLKLRGEYLHIAYPQLSISEATGLATAYSIRPSATYDIIRLGVVYDFARGKPMPETQRASWDGAFGGIYASNIGFQSSGGEAGGTLPHVNTHSFNGGVKAGYNWQNGSLVFGVVADLQSGTKEGVNYFELSGSNDRNTMQSDWTAGLNLRAGVSSGNLLLYVTGGMSASQVEMTTCHGFSTVTCFNGTNTDNESTFDDVIVGFNAGFGAEMMISSKTSIFAEYVMHRYGSVEAEQNQAGDYSEFYVEAEQLKLGVNFHF